MTGRSDDPIAAFEREKRARIAGYPAAGEWQALSACWIEQAFRGHYMYNFTWAGRPIIQLPGDMVALQEIVWAVKPDLIVETGVAHGGSLLLSASLLALLDLCEAAERGETLDPRAPKRRVIGVDIDIRAHNRAALDAHPLRNRLELIEGSSLDPAVAARVRELAADGERVLLCLDSSHSHAHVLAELELYAPLVAPGSYCLVFDTIVERLPAGSFPDRPWDRGDNPATAVAAWLALLRDEGRLGADGRPLRFERDRGLEDKLLLSLAPGGYLRRVPA